MDFKTTDFKMAEKPKKIGAKPSVAHLGREVAEKVNRFHKSFPMYEETPLRALNALSETLGVKKILVKDESFRFGLNAFKVLGGSFAIGSYIADRLETDIDALPYEKMTSEEIRQTLGPLTFISATDGNHGRGVAWTVRELKQSSVIYMPKGSAEERLENIRAEGAKADITELNYDDAVRLANRHAEENGWILVQDTSWKGYETIPTYIMQGYTTTALEALKQMAGEKPTHIFLQAGVGSFAAAVTGFFAAVYGEACPSITIVEPNEAACIYETMAADDGEIHAVTGDMRTIMAGLACGEPVTVGIDILRHYASHFISGPDYAAAQGMRVLGAPLKADPRIISGESGAAGVGMFYEIMTNPALSGWKERLKLDSDSVVLFFSTEGDTDRTNYRRIVWDGAFARP
ncbi:MAG: diaminopropionate ammonia-lyase [Clostridiales bacterium]|nr:diaminopropionate ammonia-lyase [Clostridiales bacterium]